jgi:hypothetical protein
MNVLLGQPIRVSTPDGTRFMTIAPRPAEHVTEWNFVLEHMSTIERFARRLCVEVRLQPDELRQEAIEWIVRLHGSFDPRRAAASSWIYFMVRRARQAMLVRLNREKAHMISVDPRAMYGEQGYAPEPGDEGASVVAVENAVCIAQAFERATAAERDHFNAFLLDPDRSDKLRVVSRTRRRPPASRPLFASLSA